MTWKLRACLVLVP